MKSLTLLLLLAVFVSAGWDNETALLKGPRVTVKSGKGTLKLADMSQKQPLTMMVTKKISTRWVITVPAKGTFSLTRDGKLYKKADLEKGRHVIKLYLEPGTYSAVSTVGGTVKLLKFKKEKLSPVSPADGGIPVSVSNARHAYTYFKVGEGISPVLKLNGPASAKIFVRVPSTGKKDKIDVSVMEGAAVVTHRIETVSVSDKLFIVDPKLGVKGSVVTPKPGEKAVPSGQRLSDAVVIDIKVPEGQHLYKVSSTTSGILKFYKSVPAKTKKKAVSKKPAEQKTK